jgi:NAD(P)-dependent dehydrogenase (short-subunit alcohol dehydrogenase family)
MTTTDNQSPITNNQLPITNYQLPLAGKRALITGASRGIGRTIALVLADAGAAVAVTARSLDDLQTLAAEVAASGGHAYPVVCDVADPEQVTAMVTAVQAEMGGVDILVNNAGIAASHKFVTHPDELWHRVLAVNLTSVYYVTKAVAPMMLAQQWGRIINIASVAAKAGGKYVAAYTASKHGLLGLTRALAVELVPHITVNAICPGYVDTPMTDNAISNMVARTGMTAVEAQTFLAKTNPQQRLIEPEEVAAVALLLAQEISRGITGQAINVDGGAVMW